jgi:hypothetical protein
MVNKRGWFRVLEATIASLLILGFFLSISIEEKTTTTGENYLTEIKESLKEFEINETLRNAAIIEDITALDQYFNETINPFLTYDYQIRNIKNPEVETPGENIYVGRKIIYQDGEIKELKLIILE